MPLFIPSKPTTFGFWFLASPYSHPNHHVRLERTRMAMHAVVRLMSENITAFSPIHYYHPISEEYALPRDFPTWFPHNLQLMKAAAGLIVLTIDGWNESEGVQKEIQWFRGAERPIFLMEPGNATTFQPLD